MATTFIEQHIESVIAAALVTPLTGLLSQSVTVKTYWNEGPYSEGDEKAVFPCVMMACSPVDRPTGHQVDRMATVSFEMYTYLEDDYSRSDLALLYEAVRNTIENEAFDFGPQIIYTEDSYNIESAGTIEVSEHLNASTFSVDFHFCAGAISWTE